MSNISLQNIGSNDTLNAGRQTINDNFQSIEVGMNNLLSGQNKGVYGIRRAVNAATPDWERVGDMDAHRELPVQATMRRCVVADDATVNYYLHDDDSTLREDGTPAVLDGSHGQWMHETGAHWFRRYFEDGYEIVMVSLGPFTGATFVPRRLASVGKATINRNGNILSSTINNSPDYRGGGNQSGWDGTPQSMLGKPATAISTNNFHSYAQNRGEKWHINSELWRYHAAWLLSIEYATTNHQKDYVEALDSNGFKQGGMGPGMTNLSGTEWSDARSYYPLVDVGITASLGNKTGVIPVTITDFPSDGESRQTQVFSYRGIENFFGDLWEFCGGLRINYENGVGTAYQPVRPEINSDDLMGYRMLGQVPSSNGYIRSLMEGSILPSSSSGASSTTFFADYWYIGSDGQRVLRLGGSALHGSNAGSFCAHSSNSPATTHAYTGARLCVEA